MSEIFPRKSIIKLIFLIFPLHQINTVEVTLFGFYLNRVTFFKCQKQCILTIFECILFVVCFLSGNSNCHFGAGSKNAIFSCFKLDTSLCRSISCADRIILVSLLIIPAVKICTRICGLSGICLYLTAILNLRLNCFFYDTTQIFSQWCNCCKNNNDIRYKRSFDPCIIIIILQALLPLQPYQLCHEDRTV